MDNEKLELIKEKIGNAKVAMMTTLDENNDLVSRPMYTQDINDFGFFFFTNEFSDKINEVESHKSINLAYSDHDHNTYVSISGDATLIHDQTKIQTLWNPILEAWFPKGLKDPKLALIKVIPVTAAYWDGSANKMVQLYQAAKAMLTGEEYDDGKHDVVEF